MIPFPPPMNIVTVIQARRGSTRLPDKVMLPLAGAPLLVRMAERVRAARLAGTVVVATTTDAHDDAVEVLCEAAGLTCFRGHPTDLLDRHYQAGRAYGADVVLKIPSDCPLIDPAVIDRTIARFLERPGTFDFVSNLHPPTYPDGNDVEIMPMAVLETAWREAEKPHEREHTTPFIWDRPERFRLGNVAWESGLDYSMSHRFTIDYREDYEFIRAVFEELYAENPLFGLADILRLLEEKPEIYAINAHLAGVNWYRNHLGDLKTISSEQTKTI
jgi:spore coat polysaccharide biosynthesis protein SpsF